MSTKQDIAYEVGLAFQIRDDMLDVIGDSALLGKSTGTDATKNTFVQLYGLDACSDLVAKHTKHAISELDIFSDTQFMRNLADKLTNRTM